MNWRTVVTKKDPNKPELGPLCPHKSLLFILITALGTYGFLSYIEWRLVPDLMLPEGEEVFWLFFKYFATLLVPLSLATAFFSLKTGIKSFVTWSGMLCIGFISTLFIFTILRDIVLTGLILGWPQYAVRWPDITAQLTMIFALWFTFLGFHNARGVGRVTKHKLEIKTLSKFGNGIKIAQLSDIHIGQTIGARFVKKMVKATNKLSPDVIVITGDIVDGKVHEIGHIVALLKELRAPQGVFISFGNHDYYSGCLEWQAFFESLGFKCLVNEHKLVKFYDTTIAIAGITDHTAEQFIPSHKPDPEKALKGIPANVPVIMLAHQPISASYIPSELITIQLSGHTHAGQFFPWRFFIKLQQPIIEGHSSLFDHPVYVHRGTGYWGPPKRLFSHSEIALFTLVKAGA